MNYANDLVAGVIVKVVDLYGNREDVDDQMKIECIELIRYKFSAIGLGEILLAYRMWATGDLGELPQAEMYGGKFNARQLAAIINAYIDQQRKPALKEYYQIQEVKDRQAEQEAKIQRALEYDRNFPEMIATEKGSDLKPVFSVWYDTAIRIGLMPEPDKETKLRYFEQAKQKYFDDLRNQPGFVLDPFKIRKNYQDQQTTEQTEIANIAKGMIFKDTLL